MLHVKSPIAAPASTPKRGTRSTHGAVQNGRGVTGSAQGLPANAAVLSTHTTARSAAAAVAVAAAGAGTAVASQNADSSQAVVPALEDADAARQNVDGKSGGGSGSGVGGGDGKENVGGNNNEGSPLQEGGQGEARSGLLVVEDEESKGVDVRDLETAVGGTGSPKTKASTGSSGSGGGGGGGGEAAKLGTEGSSATVVDGPAKELDPSPKDQAAEGIEVDREVSITGDDRDEDEGEEEWLMFNDFLVEKTVLDDARGFGPKWKEPCVLVYHRVPSETGESAAAVAAAAAWRSIMDKRLSIPASVFDIPSMSKVPVFFFAQYTVTNIPYFFLLISWYTA